MKNVVGKRVREARRLSVPRLTQATLARRLQILNWRINRVGIAKIESGIRQVTDIELLLLSKALSVDVQWLLEGEYDAG
ncbi:MAG: helix-turn-helix transcriptional regulator [Anaerolineales bacterium]|nr:helix-turn-helix transcriptional regulator [Anaerolineales bacterium]